LGSGGFSKVYLARCGIDGKLCALKFIQKSSIASEHKFKMLQNEKDILFTINHKRLVDLYYAV
jgi:serum/glucocorticoid-regulated kinase 2